MSKVFVGAGMDLRSPEAQEIKFSDLVLLHLLGGEGELRQLRAREDLPRTSLLIFDFVDKNPSAVETIRDSVDKLLASFPDIGIVVCGDELVHRLLCLVKNGFFFVAPSPPPHTPTPFAPIRTPFSLSH